MAVFGGFLLIFIGAVLIWIALMGRFTKIGSKVINRIEKTFNGNKGEKNND